MEKMMKLAVYFFVVSLVISLVACGEIGDPQYDGWARYKDSEDGYTLFLPPEWNVQDFNIPGFRGSRFYNEIMYTGDRSAFVYFAVIVKDETDSSSPLETVGRQTIRQLTEGIWKNLNLKTIDNSETRICFRISGDPYYTSYKLNGKVCLLRHNNKLYYLFASGTAAAYKELQETYETIFNGFKP